MPPAAIPACSRIAAHSSQRSSAAAALPVQRKLTVGSTTDPLEAEADRAAEQVMSPAGPQAMALAAPAPPPATPVLRRATQGVFASTALHAPPIFQNVLRSPGNPLDRETRAFMEPRFGQDFSRVRLHTDGLAAQSAQAVGALAYTVGPHIAFNTGAYNPSTPQGKNLLAHELAHTVQQGQVDPGAQASSANRMAIQRRRIPSVAEVDPLLDPASTDAAAHKDGVIRLIHEAWSELSEERKTILRVVAIMHGIPSWTEAQMFAALQAAGKDQLELFLADLRKVASSSAPNTVDMLRDAFNAMPESSKMDVRIAAALNGIMGNTDDEIFAALRKAPGDKFRAFVDDFHNIAKSASPGIQRPFDSELGDPKGIDIGPRNQAEKDNINKLVGEADKIFDSVASGVNDTDIKDIFGAKNLAVAKAKFAKGKAAMHRLQAAGKIVTDRSGYDREVSLGGLTNRDQIALMPEAIDNPTDPSSISTMVHESMHAGNGIGNKHIDVTDLGYIGTASFGQMSEPDKLNNAADYEVVANRILLAAGKLKDSAGKDLPQADEAYKGQQFKPAGGKNPKLTPKQQAIRNASETYRMAWTAGLNIHPLFVRVQQTPAEWNTLDLAGFGVPHKHFADSLPYWSKVMNMTIHKRTGIAPAAGKKDSNPVTLIDIAQSESVVRKMAQGMFAVSETLKDAVDAANLEKKATAAQAAEIPKGPDHEAKVLVSLIRSEKLGEITGAVERDERVIDRMAKADKAGDNFYKDVLTPKLPSTFND